MLLRPFSVYTALYSISRDATGYIQRSARRYIRYTHVLRAEGNEVAHWRRVVPLNVRAQELSALAEANSIKAVGQFCYVRQLLGRECYLLVDVPIQSSLSVLAVVLIHVNRVDEDAWVYLADLVHELIHARGRI